MTTATGHQLDTPGATPVFWQDLSSRWSTFPRRTRLNHLKSAAGRVRSLWQGSMDITALPLDLLLYQPESGSAAFPEHLLTRLPKPLSVARLLEKLADWHADARLTLAPSEGRFFLRHLLADESIDPGCLRNAAAEIDDMADTQAQIRAFKLYRSALGGQRTAFSRWRQSMRGFWATDPRIKAADLHEAIQRAEADPATQIVKDGARIQVLRANLFGHDALIKRYDLVPLGDRLKYIFRPSRARRAWAAAQALVRLRLPTPEPLGCLEIFRSGIPVRSYYICAFLTDAAAARTWIEPNFVDQPEALRTDFRKHLLRTLLALYRHGVYHADTKTTNMLLSNPMDPARRAFFWIDLECVRFGIVPGRHQLVRNLVQVNGSLGLKVSDHDRLRFLHDLARHYPWVTHKDVIRKICDWTRRRLDNERRRQCGS